MDKDDKAVLAAMKEAKRVEGIFQASVRAMANESAKMTDYEAGEDQKGGKSKKKARFADAEPATYETGETANVALP